MLLQTPVRLVTLGPDAYSLCFHYLLRYRVIDLVFRRVWVH